MKPFQKIVVATDFGDSSSLALEHGVDLAKRYGAELILVHVVEPQTSLLSGTMLAVPGTGNAAAQSGLDAGVETAQETVPGARGVLLEGHPAEKVLAFVEENAIDLLVVGTHGRSRAGRLLLGSVALKIVQGCRVPVLTIYDSEDRAIARLTKKAD